MVFNCCVSSCKKYNREAQMHIFPKDPMLFSQWVENIGRNDLKEKPMHKVRKSYRVCNIHFASESLYIGSRYKSTLKKDAIPTLFLTGKIDKGSKFDKTELLTTACLQQEISTEVIQDVQVPSTSQIMPETTAPKMRSLVNLCGPAKLSDTTKTADQSNIQPTNPLCDVDSPLTLAPEITADVVNRSETTDQSFCSIQPTDSLSDVDSPSSPMQDTTADVENVKQIEEPALRCRVCWEEKTREVLMLVTNQWLKQSTKTIKDIILICVPTMSIQDNSYICTVCFWQLRNAYSFIERCLKTETLLVQQTKNGSNRLENILEKSLEKGNKIKIIFENPQSIEGGNHDHTYVRPINERSIEENTSEENKAIKQEIEIHPNLLDDYDNNDSDDIFTETFADSTGNPNKIFSSQNIPQVLVDLLDFAPLNVRGVTINKEMSEEHRQGLLQEGINLVDFSQKSKKRIIYLGRDILFCPTKCDKCNLQFTTKAEFADHKHLHRKGKIKMLGKPAFICTICRGEFSCDREYRVHCIRFHNLRRPYQCKRCSRNFSTFKEFKEHYAVFKIGQNEKCTLTCEKCNKEFVTLRQLKSHEADVADAPCCDYLKCKICSEKFTKEDFKEHCEVHPNYPCSYCGKSLSSANSLHTHVKNVHQANPGMCHECGKIIKTPRILQQHMEIVHGDKKYICDKCPREFKSKIYLWRHLRFIHNAKNRVKNLSCEKCGKMFNHKARLKQHIDVVHIAQVKFNCLICGEGFVRKDYLQKHMAFHKKYKEFTCSVCNRSFLSQLTLMTHQNTGHDENGKPLDKGRKTKGRKPSLPGFKKKYTNPCVCNICYKVLASQASLKLHYKTHLKIREFICEKCEITLQTYTAYKNHLKRHEDPDFDLRCNICHAYRPTQEELEAHKQQVHTHMKYQCKYCPAKFGRKHLLFSHESIKHCEEYAKKEKLYKLLASQPTIAAPQDSWISRTNKGRKLGSFLDDTDRLLDQLSNENEELRDYVQEDKGRKLGSFLDDTDQLLDRLSNENEELRDYVQEDDIEYKFNISSDEYEMSEEVVACQVIKDCMEQ